MVSLYIVRHGETLLNKLGRAQGWCDSPLTAQGFATARELGAQLKGTTFAAAYYSDTIRAEETARAILEESGNVNVPVQTKKRLREWCLGTMEAEENKPFLNQISEWLGGLSSLNELNDRLADVANALHDHDTTGTTEPYEAITQRLNSALIDAAKNAPENSNILVVSHALDIKTLFKMYSPKKMEEVDKIGHATVFKLHYTNNEFHFE